jgi:hypothetical protein
MPDVRRERARDQASGQGATVKLTEKDNAVLGRALHLRKTFDCGIFPTGSQHSRFGKLERAGLLAFVGWGRDVDGELARDVAVYMLTLAGENALGVKPPEPHERLALNPDDEDVDEIAL